MAADKLQEIASRFKSVSKRGSGYQAKCPCHKDDTASLSISNGENGNIVLHCHAGCSPKSILNSLGLGWDAIMGNSNGTSKSSKKILNTYSYVDARGVEAYQVVRYFPKDFRQRRKDVDGKWVWSLNGTERYLYRLPEVIKAQQVFIVEGEKDADNLSELGVTATTCPQGAGKWKDSYNEYLTGKDVVILPDNDKPGKDHAKKVSAQLQGKASSVKIIDLPGLPPKGDVSDWIANGGTKEKLLELVESPPFNEIESRIQDLNEKHAIVMIGGKVVVMNEITDPIFNRPDISFSSLSDFRNFYSNDRVFVLNEKGESKSTSVATLWLQSPKRRQYKSIVFEPNGDINGYYNLYKGLSVEPSHGDWSLFRTHIWENIAGQNETIFKYLISWMADLVQNPGGERPGVSIVLKGKRGTGKGCFATIFGSLFSNHFLHITHQNQLTGRFNSHLKDALLVFADECFWAGDKSGEGVLKSMITEPTIMVEPKGKDAYQLRNHVRLIIASNEDWVVPAGLEERRFLALEVSDSRMQDTQYFSRIFKQMLREGGIEAMLNDLINMEITIDLRNPPKTLALFEQIEASMDPLTRFWFERLLDGTLCKNDSEWKEYVITSQLYDEYVEFCDKIGKRHKLAPNAFSRKIRNLCPILVRRQVLLPDKYDKRAWALYFDILDLCRKHFSQVVGIDINWDSLSLDYNQ